MLCGNKRKTYKNKQDTFCQINSKDAGHIHITHIPNRCKIKFDIINDIKWK